MMKKTPLFSLALLGAMALTPALMSTACRAFARAEQLTPAETAALDAAIRDHVTAAAEPGAPLESDSEDPS